MSEDNTLLLLLGGGVLLFALFGKNKGETAFGKGSTALVVANPKPENNEAIITVPYSETAGEPVNFKKSVKVLQNAPNVELNRLRENLAKDNADAVPKPEPVTPEQKGPTNVENIEKSSMKNDLNNSSIVKPRPNNGK